MCCFSLELEVKSDSADVIETLGVWDHLKSMEPVIYLLFGNCSLLVPYSHKTKLLSIFLQWWLLLSYTSQYIENKYFCDNRLIGDVIVFMLRIGKKQWVYTVKTISCPNRITGKLFDIECRNELISVKSHTRTPGQLFPNLLVQGV